MRTGRWPLADRLSGPSSDGSVVDAMPSADRFEGFNWMNTWVQRVATKPNSTLRNHINVCASNLRPCFKWGVVAVNFRYSGKGRISSKRWRRSGGRGGRRAGTTASCCCPSRREHFVATGRNASASRPALTQIRANIGAALASKVYRQRMLDGREAVIVIDADEVTAIVAEYRPIYANGDVSKPGESPYRPAITARQLIAVAGGYDIMRIRMNNPYLESADLRSEYGSLWTELAKEQAHMWRIKNELGEGSQINPGALTDVPIARSAISEIVHAETEYLKTKQSDYQQEKAFLQRAVRQGDDEVRVLSDQQKKDEEGLQSDLEDLQKPTDLFGKGSLISPRVTDARRAALLSSTTRKLQTSAQLLQVKKQQDEFVRKLTKLDDQRRLDLLHELSSTKFARSCRASARRFSTLRWFDHSSYEEPTASRKLPSLEKARMGRNGLSRAKIPSCSRGTPSRSPCDTRTVLVRLSEGRAVLQLSHW
jgi:polysaccharide export outer membrane protein